jgi:tripartite-type tricarboxylate transporter receptor subunit TctC
MVPDWQGLLKFTLTHSDGTSQSEFKEMSYENKKWLEEAMQQYCNSEIKRIEAIIKEIQNYK